MTENTQEVGTFRHFRDIERPLTDHESVISPREGRTVKKRSDSNDDKSGRQCWETRQNVSSGVKPRK